MSSGATKRILIVGPAWIGDMVMAQSLFITLKQRFPDSEIDVLAPVWSKPVLARMPEVNSSVIMPLGHGEFGFGARRRLGRLLRGRYDQAIVLPRSWKSALVPFFAGIPTRTGFRAEWRYGLINDRRPLDKSILTQTVQRFVALGLEQDASLPPSLIPKPQLRVDVGNQSALLNNLALHTNSPIVALMPGAEGPGKRWPVERYAELAKKLLASGKQVWVFGSVKEQSLGEEITQIAGKRVVNLCGSTRLEDAVDLLALAETAVTNDSGLMHIAAAVGTKLVVIYGSSSPDYTPPLTDKAEIIYLKTERDPGSKHERPQKNLNFLEQITVDDVLQRV